MISNVMVIGDVLLDKTNLVRVSKISPDSNLPVLVNEGTEFSIGGVGNIVRTLAEWDIVSASVLCPMNRIILKGLSNIKCTIYPEMFNDDIESCTRERFVTKDRKPVGVRHDFDYKDYNIDIASVQKIALKALTKEAPRLQIAAIVDYNKGFITEEFIQQVSTICRRYRVRVFYDYKNKAVESIKDVDVVKMNRLEYSNILKTEFPNNIGILKKYLGPDTKIFITLAEDGIAYIKGNSVVSTKNADIKNVQIDTCGCGDIATAMMLIGMVRKLPEKDIAILADTAARLYSTDKDSKICPLSVGRYLDMRYGKVVCPTIVQDLRDFLQCKKIIITNGVFDLFHSGHRHTLQYAKTLGDILIVCVNNDISATELKGPGRPIQSLTDRLAILGNLDYVDWVIPFSSQEQLIGIIKILHPDTLVKGPEYRNVDPKSIPGADICKHIKFPEEYDDNIHTSNTIKKIRSIK